MIDPVMALNLVANVMMNGVCCYNTMEDQERQKEEQKEMLRKAVKIEWQRHKLMEQEEQERILREQGLDKASVIAEERRRMYIAAKAMASSQASQMSQSSRRSVSSRADSLSSRSQAIVQRPTVGYVESRHDDPDQTSLPDSPAPKYHFAGDEFEPKRKGGLNQRSRSAPTNKLGHSSRRVPLIVASSSNVSSTCSLLDGDSDSDDEFDEVQLH